MYRRFPTTIYVLAICVASLFVTLFVFDEAHPPPMPALVTAPVPEKPNLITAEAWALFDPRTGRVIVGTDTETLRPIASITKLFSAAVVAQASLEDTVVQVTAEDVATLGRAGRLSVGESYALGALMFPLLLESSNDAASVIERVFGGRYEAEVATLLSRAGLSDTTLVDASGLSPANQSTPRDLAQFYAYMRATYPRLIGITELRAYITDMHEYVNTNPGRDVRGYRGGKNGFTDEAQRTFLGEFAVGGGETIGMVLLKSETLSRDIETLFAYAEAVIKSGILHAHDTR